MGMPEAIVSTPELERRLRKYTELLAAWPGLVSEPDPALVTDSLVLVDFLPEGARIVDVGSGGGLPGIPLKLARPDLQLMLIEANRRKAAFLTHAIAAMQLPGVEVVARRAEEAGHDARLREQFDVAVARALAEL